MELCLDCRRQLEPYNAISIKNAVRYLYLRTNEVHKVIEEKKNISLLFFRRRSTTFCSFKQILGILEHAEGKVAAEAKVRNARSFLGIGKVQSLLLEELLCFVRGLLANIHALINQ